MMESPCRRQCGRGILHATKSRKGGAKRWDLFDDAKKNFTISQIIRIFALEITIGIFGKMNNVNLNISLPRSDMDFMCLLGKRMGWSVREINNTDALFDPETGEYLNEETMQAIRDVEAGRGVVRCKSIDEPHQP